LAKVHEKALAKAHEKAPKKLNPRAQKAFQVRVKQNDLLDHPSLKNAKTTTIKKNLRLDCLCITF
jgi:hypothetical protein